MTHQRKLVTPSTSTEMHALDADRLRHVRGGDDALSTASNVLKTRHDTAKNTIGNIR
jgi:hypothetical protein